MKILVHDGFGVWLALRRLNQGRLRLARQLAGHTACPERRATQALVLELPWRGSVKRGDRPVIAACNCAIGRTAYRRTEAGLAQSVPIRPLQRAAD